MALPKAGPKDQSANHATLPDIEDDVEWFEYVTGAPLYEWQREDLRAVMAADRPRTWYEQMGRKGGKTYWAAAAAICEARRPGRHIYCVSDSERNLNSALMRELKDIVAASPILAAAYLPYSHSIQIPSTGSFIEARPNKFAASQSINPHMVLVDEVHLQKTDDVWHGMRFATSARADGIVIGITTPGQDVSCPAHGFYLQVKSGKMAGRIFEPHNPATAYTDRSQWIQANPRLADDPAFMEALEQDFLDVPEYQFKRYRLGLWTAGDTAWLPYGAWAARTALRDLIAGESIWLGFDGSYSGDSTALVACTADGFLKVLGCWESPGKKGWRVPRPEVEATIEKAFVDYNVKFLICDPPYWQREIAEWDRRWPGKVVEFPSYSGARMAPATTSFSAAIAEGRISHDGDARLARHVSNCVVKSSPMGDVVTKADKNSPLKIDLAIAAILAHSMAAVASTKPKPKKWVL